MLPSAGADRRCRCAHHLLYIVLGATAADPADIGLEEARRKGTNRKVVRTDPRISHNKFEPPWVRVLRPAPPAEIRRRSRSCEPRLQVAYRFSRQTVHAFPTVLLFHQEIFEGQHSIGDVREPAQPPPKLVYCHGKADALTLDSTKAKVKSIARVDKNTGKSGQGNAPGSRGLEAARVQAVTAPWHGGAWGDLGGQDVVAPGPTPPGTPPVWSSDSGGGAEVWREKAGGQPVDELTQAWQRSM